MPDGGEQPSGHEPGDEADRDDHGERDDAEGDHRGDHGLQLGVEVDGTHVDSRRGILVELDGDRDVSQRAALRGHGAQDGAVGFVDRSHDGVDEFAVVGDVEPRQRRGAILHLAVDDRGGALVPRRHEAGDRGLQVFLDRGEVLQHEVVVAAVGCRSPGALVGGDGHRAQLLDLRAQALVDGGQRAFPLREERDAADDDQPHRGDGDDRAEDARSRRQGAWQGRHPSIIAPRGAGGHDQPGCVIESRSSFSSSCSSVISPRST